MNRCDVWRSWRLPAGRDVLALSADPGPRTEKADESPNGGVYHCRRKRFLRGSDVYMMRESEAEAEMDVNVDADVETGRPRWRNSRKCRKSLKWIRSTSSTLNTGRKPVSMSCQVAAILRGWSCLLRWDLEAMIFGFQHSVLMASSRKTPLHHPVLFVMVLLF
jgi:hypothetical protein